MKKKKVFRIMGFIFFLLANFSIFLFLKDQPDDIVVDTSFLHTLYKNGNYTEIVNRYDELEELTNKDILFAMSSLIKLWYISHAWKLAQQYPSHDVESQQLYKLLFLWYKEDYQWVVDLSRSLTSDDSTLRSVYLQWWAVGYQKLDDWGKAYLLAKDSIKLDPLAPGWMMIEAIDFQAGKFRKESFDILGRMERLWYAETNEYLFYKWIAEYHLKKPLAMEKHLSAVVGDPLYQSEALETLANYFYLKWDYEKSLTYYQEKIDHIPDERRSYRFEGRIYKKLKKRELANASLQKAIDYGGNIVDVLSDKLVVLHALWDLEEYNATILQIRQKLKDSTYNYHVFILRLLEMKAYGLAWKYAEKSLELETLKKDGVLINIVAKTYIYNIINLYIEKDNWLSWHEKLIQYDLTDSLLRYIFISLWFSLQDDSIWALRALQSAKLDATERDIKTITILHHILIWDALSATRVLSTIEEDAPIDIDYLRFVRKLQELAIASGADIQIKGNTERLAVLAQLSNTDSEDMNTWFIEHFDHRLKYMKPYYQ